MKAEPESQTAVPWRHAAVPWRRIAPVALPLLAGLVLRLWLLGPVFNVDGDSLIYGGIAKNLLRQGRYALGSPGGAVDPTLIRLPGYPFFLALCFRLFGMENYFAAALAQIALDLLGCLLLAAFVRRIAPAPFGRRAALAALWLAALCPFTASYAAMPLAETPTLFAIALALWSMARFQEDPRWANALWWTLAVTAAALLRPDGALLAIALAPAFFGGLEPVSGQGASALRARLRMAAVCLLLALLPFAVWTLRNWRVFHVFEPLAPRLANDPGEPANSGWERWVASWCLDFQSTAEVYWNVPDNKLDVHALPARAFDTSAERAATMALVRDYNHNGMKLTPAIDARFGQLARQRIAAHPLRFFLWLPLGRLADMGLRPRVENLDIDLDWWVYAHHWQETVFCWAYAGLNALYLLLAVAGLAMRPRFGRALLVYLLLRSALLLTVSAPETRYTIECFPMFFALGGLAIGRWMDRRNAEEHAASMPASRARRLSAGLTLRNRRRSSAAGD